VAGWYGDALATIPGLRLPASAEWADAAWFVYFLRVDDGIDRNRVVELLGSRGIEAKAYFDPPIHGQPPYAGVPLPAPLEVTEDASRRTLIVPFFAGMTNEDVARVAGALSSSLEGASR
jgi:dTDP-4-amino-4,6-dideoxygalactose transaminase